VNRSLLSDNSMIKFIASKQSLDGLPTNAETIGSNQALTNRSIIANP